MRGTNAAPDVIVRNPRPERKKASPPSTEPADGELSSTPDPGWIADFPAAPGKPSKIIRPRPMPMIDLTAMRELANTHARTVIDRHGNKRLLKLAMHCFVKASISLVTAIAIFRFNFMSPRGAAALQAGCMVLIVGCVYWTSLGAASATEYILSRWTQKNDSEDGEDQSSPENTPPSSED